MRKKIYEIKSGGITELIGEQPENKLSNHASLYIIDIQTSSREEAGNELLKHNVGENIIEAIREPEEHIRFQFIDKCTYGELAYFSESQNPPLSYIAAIGHTNKLYLVYDNNDKLSEDIIHELTESIIQHGGKVDIEYVLYIIIHEILSVYGELILRNREKIEDFAKVFDRDVNDIEPEEFLEAKSHLSDFSRVFEKLYYTLNFPPAKDKLDKASTFSIYFIDLLKTLEILKLSLLKTEDRINSLHNHYLLLLQEKSNKRINFLTIIQAIFVPLTLIAGIYGMNFKFMPELEFKYGYIITMAAMILVAVVFLRYFYKHGWFD